MEDVNNMDQLEKIDCNIFLIGFMGAGKSTIAGELAKCLKMERVEMDEMIVQNQGMAITCLLYTSRCV